MHGLLREMEHWRTFIIVIVLLLPCLPGPNSPILHLPELSGIPDHPGVRQSYVRCSRCSSHSDTGRNKWRATININLKCPPVPPLVLILSTERRS